LPFLEWSGKIDLQNEVILEPFAGENSLIKFLINNNLCNRYASFDIEPKAIDVHLRDSLKDFPIGFDTCVTNPPWLAKNSATKMQVPFYAGEYDDLYKYSLSKCLENCKNVIAIIPESFIRANLFSGRLNTFISLTNNAFDDTTHPVGMALFDGIESDDVKIYRDNHFIGMLSEIEKKRPPYTNNTEIIFNEQNGNIGLIALDNCKEASIRFCDPKELRNYEVKKHGRHITIINAPFKPKIKDYNDIIKNFRQITQDVLMTSYRGIRKDGFYRRRLDWQLAKDIICYAA
jgi:hypothetical protein